jgi:hypothetical protein
MDSPTRLGAARDLALQVFRETGRRWSTDDTGAGVAVPVPDLPQRIVSYSFAPATARALKDDGSVVGRPTTMREEGVQMARTAKEEENERKASDANWERSSLSWRYWVCQVHWWNDGKSVTIYFLKVEEGAWLPSFGDKNIDRNFFKIPGSRKSDSPSN